MLLVVVERVVQSAGAPLAAVLKTIEPIARIGMRATGPAMLERGREDRVVTEDHILFLVVANDSRMWLQVVPPLNDFRRNSGRRGHCNHQKSYR